MRSLPYLGSCWRVLPCIDALVGTVELQRTTSEKASIYMNHSFAMISFSCRSSEILRGAHYLYTAMPTRLKADVTYRVLPKRLGILPKQHAMYFGMHATHRIMEVKWAVSGACYQAGYLICMYDLTRTWLLVQYKIRQDLSAAINDK